MIFVNQTDYLHATALNLTSLKFPNLFIGMEWDTQTAPAGTRVILLRECSDSIYRAFEGFIFRRPGARSMTVPAGNYKFQVVGGPATVEAVQL